MTNPKHTDTSRSEGVPVGLPYRPSRLTSRDAEELQPNLALHESEAVRHVFLVDETHGFVGPAALSFDGGQFVCWQPALTYDRAVMWGRKMVD